MWSPFRKKHLETVLDTAFYAKESLDFHMHKYFKQHHALGSKDRLWIKKGVYEIIKWKGLLEAYKATSVKELVTLYTEENCPIGKDNSHLPSHVEVSFPKWLFKKISDTLGYEKAMQFCKISNEEAPVTIRINPQKCDKEEFFKLYQDELNLTQCEFAKYGFHLGKKVRFDLMPDFLKGHFEPQDEGSQMIAEYVNAKPSQQILDYCAGSGGKALAFAPFMKGKGQVHLHDIRKKPLIDAKKRLNRAGIQNIQIYHEQQKRLSALIGHMDTVLVDAPCSCSGTFRRRPDQKWDLTEDFLEEVVITQRDILVKAIPFVKQGGMLIYATCSILKEENQDQTDFLKQREGLTFISEHSIALNSMGADAMYLSIFRKNSLV